MDTAKNHPVLEVRGLTKRFGGLTAVKNLSLDLHGGEIFGLIGPNGSGKSTAMKAIMGIERPSAGEIIFQGENVAGLPAHKIARKGFGMVFQHSRPLNRQTVLENIMVALLPDSLLMFFADKALTERAEWIANRVGLGAVSRWSDSTAPARPRCSMRFPAFCPIAAKFCATEKDCAARVRRASPAPESCNARNRASCSAK